MTLVQDLMAWYHCTEEAAEYIARCAVEKVAETGEALQNDLKSIAEAAGLPFFIGRRRNDLTMTLSDIQHIQHKTAELRAVLFADGGGSA